MLEKVIENWLDRVNELGYQVAFCEMLAAEGFHIVHLTRQCGMELGKDVLAIDPDGVPCAFQLKTALKGRFPLREWREINGQLSDLLAGTINHPSIDSTIPHRSFLVVNGFLDEEVSRVIDDWNKKYLKIGSKLEVWPLDRLRKMANKLGPRLWPFSVKDARRLLHMFLLNGNGPLEKQKLFTLFGAVLRIDNPETSKPLKRTELMRRPSSAALLCAIATSRYTEAGNHVAQVEAWTMYLAHVHWFLIEIGAKQGTCKNEIIVAEEAIFNSLGRLLDEATTRQHWIEGDPISDGPFLRVRVTHVLALLAIHALQIERRTTLDDERIKNINQLITANIPKLHLWGEAAIPQIMAIFWFLKRSKEGRVMALNLLKASANGIIQSAVKDDSAGSRLPSPYYSAEKAVPYALGFQNLEIGDSFGNRSYCLDGLIHLLARAGEKDFLKALWKPATHVARCRFVPRKQHDNLKWKSKQGVNETRWRPRRQEWDQLVAEAGEQDGADVPKTFSNNAESLLLFYCTFPHRMTASAFRFLDAQLQVKDSD